MITYPKIMDLYSDMLFDDLNEYMSKKGYQLEKKNESLYNNFYVRSKFDTECSMCSFNIGNNKIFSFFIYDWHEFFDFSDDIEFNDIIDLFRDYFLKDYTFRFTYSFDGSMQYIKNENWEIIFYMNSEYIDFIRY